MEGVNKTFEQQWEQRIGSAEVAPPSQVWTAIDRELANDEALVYKKEAQLYRWAAAACLLLFVLGSVFYWFGNGITNQSTIAIEEEGIENNSSDEEKRVPIVLSEKDENEKVNAPVLSEHVKESKIIKPVFKSTPDVYSSKKNLKPSVLETKYSASLTTLTPKPTHLKSELAPWETDQLYGVARTWDLLEPLKKERPVWAGVSMSTGSFDPGFGSRGGQDMVFASQEGFLAETSDVRNQTSSPVYASGQSVAGGFNVGKKVAERIELSSGLHYSAFNTGSASSQVVADADNNAYALTNETSDVNLSQELDAGNLRYAGEQVQLANEYQYLTIPIKAGYVILDKKFNITFNTGLSGNILVDSNLKAESNSEQLNNDFGTTSHYKDIYFNFLTSVEFGYSFKEHYQLLLEPNYNQALTEFTNSNHSNQAKPRNVGVSIGFRYNF